MSPVEDAGPEGPPRSSALAIWALYAGGGGLLSALGMMLFAMSDSAVVFFGLLCLLGFLLGLIFGLIALMRHHPGRGNAIAGVALGAVGLLAVVLFPMFARARGGCCYNSCMSNVKQIQLGLIMYASDYNQMYPPAATDKGVPVYWPSLVLPYIKAEQIFLCPSDEVVTGSIVLPKPNDPTNLSYGRNSFMGTKGLSDAAIKYPDEMMGVIDAVSPTITYNAPYAVIQARIAKDGLPANARHAYGDTSPRGCNQSFMDGHVKWIAFANIPDPAGGSPPPGSAAKHFWQGKD
jgi:prepilin-type processing-associated H-X9-DG protein